jgi:hypothetical protein
LYHLFSLVLAFLSPKNYRKLSFHSLFSVSEKARSHLDGKPNPEGKPNDKNATSEQQPGQQLGQKPETGGSDSDSGGGTGNAPSQEQSPLTRSGECLSEGFYADPQDCAKFYRCVDFQKDGKNFTKFEFDCEPGKYIYIES